MSDERESSDDERGGGRWEILAADWPDQAEENVMKWGQQDLDTLLLAAQEELGELTQAHLEARAEGGDPARIKDELDDLGALLFQIYWEAAHRYPDVGGESNGE